MKPPIKNGFAYDKATRTAYYDLLEDGRKGRRVRKIVRDIGYRDALKKKRAFRQELEESPRRRPGKTLTLTKYLTEYPTRLGRHAASTLTRHKEFQQLHLLPHLGDHAIDKLTRAVVLSWRNGLLDDGLSPSTVNRCVAHLVMLLNEGIDRDEIKRRPCGKIKPLAEPPPKDAYLTPEERTRFLDAFNDWEGFQQARREALTRRYVVEDLGAGPRARRQTSVNTDRIRCAFTQYQNSRVFFLAALDTGMDRGDLLALRIDDLTFDVGSGLVRCVRGKTRQDTWIPMTDELREALLAHLADAPQRFPTATVFPDLAPIRVQRYFAIAKAIAGLDDRFRFKDLRHSFASALVQAGVDLYTVQKLMAHSTPRMTQRYAHLAPKKFQDAIAAMQQFNQSNQKANVGKFVGNSPGPASKTEHASDRKPLIIKRN